ncbi:MAG: S41 family peptidase [Planctomycetes bacterium]|nr:S41 family peptidase [Planctomycetota bacterium]
MAKGRMWFDVTLLAILAVAVLGSTLALTRQDEREFFTPVVGVKRIITQTFVTAPDDKKMQEGAIKGMVETLNDPFTIYVPESEKRNFEKDLTGEYVGIGAQVNIRDGWLTIVSPLEDSPAYRAGILPEDRVVGIDGKSTQGKTVDECIDILLGEPGTKVKLSIERKGSRIEMELVRAPIKSRSVKGFHRDPNNPEQWQYLIDPTRKIGYLRLTQFTPKCSEEVEAALRSVGAHKGDLKGLILDLRGNPGGLLSDAVRIADLFLKDGTIVSTKGRSVPEEKATAQGPGTLPDFPVAVLVNGQSASASEVLAGALADNKRAIVVGSRSYGKGSVQVVIPLDKGGGELKITQAGYFLPNGRSIDRQDDSTVWGVDPTDGFFVPLTEDQEIEILLARRDQEVIRQEGTLLDVSTPDLVKKELKDAQLAAALQTMQAKVEAPAGEWLKTGQAVDGDKGIAAGEMAKTRLASERLARELVRLQRRMDAMESGIVATKRETDLWADTAEIKGGEVRITDKDGKLVAVLEITGNSLEQWLLDADVKKKAESSPEKK